MKISLNWLRDYVALDASHDEISRAITFLGFEVEQIIRTGAPKLSHVVVGEVLVRDKHPNADKLSVCTVNLGDALGVVTAMFYAAYQLTVKKLRGSIGTVGISHISKAAMRVRHSRLIIRTCST